MRNPFISSCLLLALCFSVSAQKKGFLNNLPQYIENTSVFELNQEEGRAYYIPEKNLSLNGKWKFFYSDTPDGIPQDFYTAKFNDTKWSSIDVPGNWEMKGFGDKLFRNVRAPYNILAPKDKSSRGFGGKPQQDFNPFGVSVPYVPKEYNPTGAYRMSFNLPANFKGGQTFLRFEKVASASFVWVNGQEVGSHVGGNLPFQFDITAALHAAPNSLTVRVEDATGGAQLRGKQTLTPKGIFYTRNSGIWQTVWLEQVPERWITKLAITTDITTGEISIKPTLAGTPVSGERLRAVVSDGGKPVAEAAGELVLKVPQPKLWSPASPHLYDLKITLGDAAGKTIDQVSSYTGLRKVGRERDKDGNYRFTLNDKPIFHWGPLDQGWWPDGLLTPPSDAAMVYDIQWLKDAGFNMIRKHIKVEPQRYYYHCDQIGMLVWQDQVSGGKSPKWAQMSPDPQDAEWSDADHQQWLAEFDGMISLLEPFPSIVVWTPFNEAWGQHRTLEVGAWTMRRDPTRLVNAASGGNFWETGHIADAHSYPNPAYPLDNPRYQNYVRVVGEFGGHGWPVPGHLWDESKANWGYGGLPKSIDEYRERYAKSIAILTALKAKGVAGGVYTQTTDVEGEINGLMTYDRKVAKIPAAELKKINAPLTAE